jgi:hypothetical protein
VLREDGQVSYLQEPLPAKMVCHNVLILLAVSWSFSLSMHGHFKIIRLCHCMQLSHLVGSTRYYCSRSCQVSDWPRHKEYHKSLENDKHKQGSQHAPRARGSLVLHDDGAKGEAGFCIGETKDGNGMTAQLRAVSYHNWREVKNLILGGADPLVTDGKGLTALHYAAFYGSVGLA